MNWLALKVYIPSQQVLGALGFSSPGTLPSHPRSHTLRGAENDFGSESARRSGKAESCWRKGLDSRFSLGFTGVLLCFLGFYYVS